MVKKITQLPKKHGNICVPIMAENNVQLITQLKDIITYQPDLIEWRIDSFNDYQNIVSVKSTMSEIRALWGSRPLLLTLRTTNEGGNADISSETYQELLQRYCQELSIDFLDIEYKMDVNIESLNISLEEKRITPVISFHSFEQTLTAQDMFELLEQMVLSYPDGIYKCALMPQSFDDVLTIMSVAHRFGHKNPSVIIAMGNLGKVTRVLTEYMHNLITFASAGCPSAPGQLSIEEVRQVMGLLNSERTEETGLYND